MRCFASLAPLFAQLNAPSILLTPHRTGAGSTLSEDLLLLTSGAFDAGVLGIRRSPTSRAFAAWYLDVLSFHCVNDPPLPWADRVSQSAVLFVDQRWLDLVPACFPEVVVARDRSVNLGHWNVGHDTIEWRDRRLFIGEDRVVLFHLSGWREDQPHRLSRYSALDWSHRAAWADVHASYREVTSLLRPHFNGPYRFHAYPGGTPIPRAHRRRYRQHLLAGGGPSMTRSPCRRHSTRPRRGPAPRSPAGGPDPSRPSVNTGCRLASSSHATRDDAQRRSRLGPTQERRAPFTVIVRRNDTQCMPHGSMRRWPIHSHTSPTPDRDLH
jgi:hypothetical protein